MSTVCRLLPLVLMGLALPIASPRGPFEIATSDEAAQHSAPELHGADATPLVCQELKLRITSEIASERAQCQRQIASFEECRAGRRDLEGVELVTCGLGLFAGVANGKFEQPLQGAECGVDKATNPRSECTVPACESELVDLETAVLTRHGLSTLPSC